MQTLMKLKMIGAVCTFAFVTACGGGSGGGGSSTSESPPAPVKSTDTFQVRTAYNNYLLQQDSRPFVVSGMYTFKGSYPITGSGRTTWGPLLSAAWEGSFAYSKASTITGNTIINGVTSSLAGTSTMYVDANYNPLGFTGTNYVDVTSFNNIPVTATVDYSAEWYKANIYTSSSKSSVSATRTVSMTIEPDTAHTAILAIITTDKSSYTGSITTTTSRFRITPAGLITSLSETTTNSDKTLTITYQ